MRHELPTICRPLDPPISTQADLAALVSYPPDQFVRLVQSAPDLYSSFPIPKSNGGLRIIRPPKRELRDLQRKILDIFQQFVRYPRWMTGGVPKRSIFDHAKPHVGQEMVATFDVHAFFPSTNERMVRTVLDNLGLRDSALDSAVRLVTKDNQLPQGGPTSLFLANLVLDRADPRIDALCRKHEINFTRYVDDIAISGNKDLSTFKGAIVSSIEECGYKVASKKIQFMARNKPQVITKLQVNARLRPTKSFITDVKESVWLCLKIGAWRASILQGVTLSQLKNSLNGKVNHIANADARLGTKLRHRLYGVDWKSRGVSKILEEI